MFSQFSFNLTFFPPSFVPSLLALCGRVHRTPATLSNGTRQERALCFFALFVCLLVFFSFLSFSASTIKAVLQCDSDLAGRFLGCLHSFGDEGAEPGHSHSQRKRASFGISSRRRGCLASRRLLLPTNSGLTREPRLLVVNGRAFHFERPPRFLSRHLSRKHG